MKVNCAAKKTNWQQSIANFKYFGGVLNGVLIGTCIPVYLRNGINIISCNHISCFVLVSNRQRLCHIIISSRKKLLHMETKGSVYIYNTHLFSENSP